MKHFSKVEWTDYVRGFTEDAASSLMRAHLDTGCERCGNTVRVLEKLVAVIAADTSPAVPQYVVHNAKSLFALQQAEKVSLPSQIARLVYDSFRQPLTAGVRNQQRPSRHAAYQAADFSVDLRFDREVKGGALSLVGQVLHCGDPAAAVANTPVSLLAGQRVIAQQISNEYGEFHFEYEPTHAVRLHVHVDKAGKSFEVRLNELSVTDFGRDDVLADADAQHRAGKH